MHRQISDYVDTILSKFQYSFRKRYIAENCMVEICKKAIDQGKKYGALHTDLSKVSIAYVTF